MMPLYLIIAAIHGFFIGLHIYNVIKYRRKIAACKLILAQLTLWHNALIRHENTEEYKDAIKRGLNR